MIVTTTPTIEGKTIVDYRGIVCGEVINGVDFIRDFAAGITNFLGGRSHSYEDELLASRQAAMDEMVSRAQALGANAVVGVDLDYETLGSGGSMLMVIATGTAVVIR